MRILFITSTRVGDAILSTGLLDHLLCTHPTARVTVACGPAAESLFRFAPGLERIIVLDKMVFSLHWPGLWARCAHRVWDIVVDLRRSPMSFVLMARKRYRLGRSRPGVHRVKQLAAVLGLEDKPPSPRLWLADENIATARRLIPDGGPVLAIGPTANWRAKSWRPEYFSDLVTRLTAPGGMMPGARVALIGRDDERPSVLRLIDDLPDERKIDLVGHLDLLDVYACLARCDFYIGNDSGLMHLAAATGRPTLGLFGPSDEKLYAPWGNRTATVRTAETDKEMYPDNFDHRTSDSLMDGLSVQMVEDAAQKLWDRTSGGPRAGAQGEKTR